MKNKTNYIKVASHEAQKGNIKNILLLYSGGLDTSVMLKWILEKYQVPVTTLTMDLGQQHDDLSAIAKKALKYGAKDAIILDVKDEFADTYLTTGIKANACYQGDYHLSTPIARAITASKAVEVAHQIGADTIAHGCTGKGNDQVRLEGYMLTNDSHIKVIAPVREWNMDRDEEIHYAETYGIPVPVTIDFPYSVDDNMWGMTWEGGEIEDPKAINNIDAFLTTYTLAKNAPDKEEYITLTFTKGIPTAINGKEMKLSELIIKLNGVAGVHGVGVVQMMEDRLVGLKNGGVYELPAAHIIITAHKALEKLVSTRSLNEIKEVLDIKWGYLVYGALYFDQSVMAINAFNNAVNEVVSGVVTLKLYKGKADVVAMESPHALSHTSFSTKEGYKFNVNASAGFTEIYSLQMKIAHEVMHK
jgi:argininosuccinate synthase